MPDWNVTWDAFAEPNITGLYDAFAYYNTVTNDVFGAGLMMALYAIFILVFSKWGIDKSFAASSFIMFVLSSILRATSLVGDIVVVFFMIMTAVSVVLMMRSK